MTVVVKLFFSDFDSYVESCR